MSGDPRSSWSPSSLPPLGDFPSDGPFRYTHLNDAALHFSFPILCFYLPAIVAADLFLTRQPRSFIPERVTLRFACGRAWGTAVRNVFLFRCRRFSCYRGCYQIPFSRKRRGPRRFASVVKAGDGLTREISAGRRQFALPKMNCYNRRYRSPKLRLSSIIRCPSRRSFRSSREVDNRNCAISKL